MTEVDLSVRGISERILRAYLSELGARPDAHDASRAHMTANAWSVTWSRRPVSIGGSASLRLTQFDLVFSGDADMVMQVREQLRKEAQRGGG